jgi:hypothetical protein
MVRQFLRRVFAGRKNYEEHPFAMTHTEKEENIEVEVQAAGTESVCEEIQDEPYVYVITRDNIEHHSYKQIVHMVEDILKQIEAGRRREGLLQLRLSPELVESMDEFLGKRIGKYIEGAERETYDATAFFDWKDEETIRIYRTFVLPGQKEKQQTFIQSRLVMIYDTCEAIGWDARQVAGTFAEVVGWSFTEDDFFRFEDWLQTMSERMKMEEEEEESPFKSKEQPSMKTQERDEEFAHITPIQISRDEVEREDISQIAAFFEGLLEDKERVRQKKAGLVFSFYGFSGELEDVMHDEAVNAWASHLVEQYPYIFYFLNDDYVPMTRFVTSMVVTSRMKGEELFFDEEELTEFIHFIQEALTRLAEWTGEDPHWIVQEFERKLF